MSNVNHTIKPYDQTYTGDKVKRLLNVAFSRTKDKLFVLCDLEHFKNLYSQQFVYQCFDSMKKLSSF